MAFSKAFGVWCLLTVFWPTIARSESWQLIHAMTDTQLSAEVEAAKAKGLVPVEIDAVTRDGETRYTAIWLDEMGEDWSLWIGMDLEGVEAKIDEFGRTGMFPASISVEMLGGEPRYSAVWLPYDGDAVKWTLGRSPAHLDNDLREFSREGFLPVAISGFDWSGDTRYAVVWRENTDSIEWALRYGMSFDDLEQHVREVAASGLSPIDISAFWNGSRVEFAVISVRMDGVAGEIGIGMSATEVNERPANIASRPTVFAEYDTPTGARFVVGWYREIEAEDGVAATKSVPNLPSGAASPNGWLVPAGREVVLSIAPVIQQTPVWCWVSVGEMVFRHLGVPNANPAGNYQCGIIGRLAPPGSPCDRNCMNCIVPSGSNAGMLGMLKEYTYEMTGQPLSYIESGRIEPDAIVHEIDNGRPVIAGVSTSSRQTGQAEHVALVVGYVQGANELELVVNDPFPYPRPNNPYLTYRGTEVAVGRYRIPYSSFRDGVFWHWSVHSIRLR